MKTDGPTDRKMEGRSGKLKAEENVLAVRLCATRVLSWKNIEVKLIHTVGKRAAGRDKREEEEDEGEALHKE